VAEAWCESRIPVSSTIFPGGPTGQSAYLPGLFFLQTSINTLRSQLIALNSLSATMRERLKLIASLTAPALHGAHARPAVSARLIHFLDVPKACDAQLPAPGA